MFRGGIAAEMNVRQAYTVKHIRKALTLLGLEKVDREVERLRSNGLRFIAGALKTMELEDGEKLK